MTPTVERFRRLARSSPWRWDAIAFTLDWPVTAPVQATVERPDRLRVVDHHGLVVTDGAFEPTGRGGTRPDPDLDDDGLATAVRRVDCERDSVPMWTSYLWSALLDPAELADGVDGDPAVDVVSLQGVTHHGREAWEAVVRPRPSYAPLCACCALLPCARADVLEGQPLSTYADAHLVRLDVATAVCVLSREVGGPRHGRGHDLRLTQVRPGPARRRLAR